MERALHDDCKAIVGLRPTKHITIANAATLEDGDVPRQRGAQANQQTTLQTNTTLGTRGAEVRGDKTSPVYWLNGRTKAVLQNLVDELGLEVPAGAKRKDLGEALASFHGSLAGAPVAPLQAEVATPDDAGTTSLHSCSIELAHSIYAGSPTGISMLSLLLQKFVVAFYAAENAAIAKNRTSRLKSTTVLDIRQPRSATSATSSCARDASLRFMNRADQVCHCAAA